MARIVALGALLALSALGVGGAAAQQPIKAQDAGRPQKAPQAAVSADPAMTSATYGDWIMRCQTLTEGAKPQKLCEVAQLVQLPNQPGPVAQIAVGHLPTDTVVHLTAVLPPSVSFPSSVQVTTGDKSSSGFDLQWRRCLPGGCFADAAPSDDQIRIWRAQTQAGTITFKDASGRAVELPLSFRGLAQALDALPKS